MKKNEENLRNQRKALFRKRGWRARYCIGFVKLRQSAWRVITSEPNDIKSGIPRRFVPPPLRGFAAKEGFYTKKFT